jgi:hypothetical protein
MKYAVEMGSNAIIYIKFREDWLRHSKVEGRDTDTQTA